MDDGRGSLPTLRVAARCPTCNGAECGVHQIGVDPAGKEVALQGQPFSHLIQGPAVEAGELTHPHTRLRTDVLRTIRTFGYTSVWTR